MSILPAYGDGGTRREPGSPILVIWLASVLAYAGLGELRYRGGMAVIDASGLCRPNPVDYGVLISVIAVSIWLAALWRLIRLQVAPVKVAIFAISAAAAGSILGEVYYSARSARGPRCPGLDMCAGCSLESSWFAAPEWILPLLFSGGGAFIVAKVAIRFCGPAR